VSGRLFHDNEHLGRAIIGTDLVGQPTPYISAAAEELNPPTRFSVCSWVVIVRANALNLDVSFPEEQREGNDPAVPAGRP
jgi:hypothetical protein